MSLSPEQCRAARGLLNWTQDQLAEISGLSRSTVKDFEANRHTLQRRSEEQLVEAFARGGVEFLAIGAPATGSGVCLRGRCPDGG